MILINSANGDPPVFLASVTSPEEARQALSSGASIIDCKDPATGALGALKGSVIRSIVEAVDGRALVSATIGDLPSDPVIMVNAAEVVATTGADIVKVGFFGDYDASVAIAALGRAHLGKARLVAVLMADRSPDFSLIAKLTRAGFAGVMLDTADKSSGALPDVLDTKTLADFIALAKGHGLSSGLAGSLRLKHIAALVALAPDVIGFRGALCDGGRMAALNVTHVRAVRDAIDAATASAHCSKRSVA